MSPNTMFRFHHCRNRSLIPVADMGKADRQQRSRSLANAVISMEEVPEPQTPRQRRNLAMIYMLFLAEAIMASSLASQIHVLTPFSTGCMTMNTSFLRGILQCAYFFGSAMGVAWGFAADRVGRRQVALGGLIGMSLCCLSMGFATSFTAFAVLRFAAGAISSAVTVSGLAMLADSTHGSNRRTLVVARLPMVVVCGHFGPLLANSILYLAEENISGILAQFPGLVSQVACAALVFSITLVEIFLLEETLPTTKPRKAVHREDYVDSEKAAFLAPTLTVESEDSLNISIIEALALDDDAAPLPSRISIAQMLTAPSILSLLASFSMLSLHSSTFDVMLPHLGHTATSNGGMGLPCGWLPALLLLVSAFAALRIWHGIPRIVARVGLRPLYRRISLAFPPVYLLTPLLAFAVHTLAPHDDLPPAIISLVAMLAKTALAGAARVLVLLLALSAAPDANSTGTLLGVVSISELFKALAVGSAAMVYYLSDAYSMLVVNGTLWAALAATAGVGAWLTLSLRDTTPRVGTDLPEECFAWQGMFDAEDGDEKNGF